MTERSIEPDPELRRALDAWRVPPPPAAFRAAVRARFLAGNRPRDAGEALDSLRPVARPEFRDALRERFLCGSPAEALPGRGRRLRTGALAAVLAAAAALVLWLALPVERAFAVDPRGFVAAGIAVDGAALPAEAAPEDLAARLAEARTVSTGDRELRLVYRDLFVVELGPRTELELKALGEEGPLVLAGDRGEYRVATGPGFERGRRELEFHTPVRSLRVVGTVFGVDVLEGGIVCICCNEGCVETWLTGRRGDGDRTERVEARGTLLSTASDDTRRRDFDEHQDPLRALGGFWERWPRR